MSTGFFIRFFLEGKVAFGKQRVDEMQPRSGVIYSFSYKNILQSEQSPQ